MDVLLSLFALILLSPVLLTVAALIRLKLGKPVIFKQKRPGLNERLFTLYKFRTMTSEKDQYGNLLPDDKRLTRFGKMLRATSLDELPELWNIMRGDMSVIGPRPQLVRDMIFMSPEQRRRHTVRPGLSGLAQINGRNDITWEDKLNYDLMYVSHITFWGDWKVIITSLLKAITRESINTEGMETAEDYGDYLLRTGKVGYEFYAKRQTESNRLIMND